MLNYIIGRIFQLILVVFVVTLVIFILFRVLIPGDPALAMLGMDYTKEAYDNLREEMGLNDNLFIQYLKWVENIFKGDLGNSIIDDVKVLHLILKSVSITFVIALIAITISGMLAILISLSTAYYNNSLFDHITRTFTMIGICMPTEWLSIIVILFFALYLGLFPAGGYIEIFHGWDSFLYFFLPILVLVSQQVSVLVRFLRSNVLDVINSDYIRTARSKGLSEFIVLFKHVLRNSIIPFVTLIGLSFAKMIGGMVIVEKVFNIPGMGRLLIRAISNRDYPVIQGTLLIIAIIYVIINLIIDLSYAWIDPRIRVSNEEK